MGPPLRATFEVAGFICYGNIRESVFKQKFAFEPPFGRVRGKVWTSPIVR